MKVFSYKAIIFSLLSAIVFSGCVHIDFATAVKFVNVDFGDVNPDTASIAVVLPDGIDIEELNMLRKSISSTRLLKGHKMLWGNITTVRDMKFTSFSPAKYPVMCEDLWL